MNIYIEIHSVDNSDCNKIIASILWALECCVCHIDDKRTKLGYKKITQQKFQFFLGTTEQYNHQYFLFRVGECLSFTFYETYLTDSQALNFSCKVLEQVRRQLIPILKPDGYDQNYRLIHQIHLVYL